MACEICQKPYTPPLEDNTFHSDDKPHVCSICGKSFSLKIQLKRHLMSHEGDVPYVCNTCEKHLDENCSYNLRLSQKGNFTCETCNKCFTSKRLLLRHASEHTLESVLHCDECDEYFKNVTALKRHTVIHRSKKVYPKNNISQKEVSETPYICNECGKAFTHLQQYEKHCLLHQKHTCSVCHMFFTSKKLLHKHQENGNCQSKIINNSSMDSSNLSFDNLNSNSDEKKHACVICNKSFTRKSALEGHMASHLAENRESAAEDDSDNDADFQCNFKGDKFNEESKKLYLPKLKIRRTFQCEKCEVVCATKKSLNTHMLSHQNMTENCIVEGKKSYACRICNETFISKDDYKKHKVSHDAKQLEEKSSLEKEQKFYNCEICDKVFAKRKHLKKHLKSHSVGEDPHENNSISSEDFHAGKRRKRSKDFSCSFCGKLFAGETCLKKHEAKHADDDKEDSINKGKKGKKPKILICEICKEDFTGRRHVYIKHKLSHTPEVCGICDARFPDRASLREHCRVHIGTEEGRRFVECSQKALDAKNGILPPEPKVEYIYLVLR